MQQNSGFENRLIDTYHRHLDDTASTHLSENVYYASVFKPNDSITITVFPGVKADSCSAAHEKESELRTGNVILPVALLLTAILFIFLKNTLKSSVGNLFLVGISPKSLQEVERRQIGRNTQIINAINAISFFSIALILYAFTVRFDFLLDVFKPQNISENVFYMIIFAAVVGAVLLFFYARSGLIIFFGKTFSASKTLSAYQKPYKLLFVSLSPVLFLVALFTAFAPFFLMSLITFYIFICLSVCYVVFVVISLVKFLNFTNRYTIHIFLYLCTLEILPLLIMVKLTQNVYF